MAFNVLGMTNTTAPQPGDTIDIGTHTFTLVSRKGFGGGMKWNWLLQGELGEVWLPTAEEAIADAARDLGAPTCTHGQPTTRWCVDCHDSKD